MYKRQAYDRPAPSRRSLPSPRLGRRRTANQIPVYARSAPIYSENYGLQVKDLFGQDSSVVEAVLAGRIAEALQMDERITAVSGFTFTRSRESLHVAFTVTSTEGSFPAEVTMII